MTIKRQGEKKNGKQKYSGIHKGNAFFIEGYILVVDYSSKFKCYVWFGSSIRWFFKDSFVTNFRKGQGGKKYESYKVCEKICF